MHSDITFIASDLLAAEKVQNILRESPANCQVVLSNTQDLEEVSRSQVAQGAKVLIAFGMFAKIVRQSVDVPVIMVDLQAEDVMDALLEASKLGKRIAIFGFRRVLKDVFYVRDLLSIDLVWLPTVSPEKIPHELEKVQDIDVLVGGYYQARIAKQYGIPTVLIKTRDSEIRKAISLAQSYLEKRQDESETGTPMMESSIYAAITVDCLGEILMMNRLASEYLKLDQLNAVAFSVDDVCPQFSRIADVISTRRPYLNQIAKLEDRIFLYHAEPILRKRDGTLEGVSVIFQDVNTVMSSEVSIRRTLTTKENQAVYSFDHILGNSPCMTQALRLALRSSKVDETVLIQGETGVGKEMFAQGIHRASRRRDMPFVAVNCASLPESILESELFGYVKGAFTGASRDGKRGLFECAHTGTIFLDEIGEISPSMQGKLLRVLQEHSIRRIGAETPIPIDIRIIVATNRDLVSMVREGTFRADLYFRINVLGLCIPPLRQRQGDIILLADAFLSETSERDAISASAAKPKPPCSVMTGLETSGNSRTWCAGSASSATPMRSVRSWWRPIFRKTGGFPPSVGASAAAIRWRKPWPSAAATSSGPPNCWASAAPPCIGCWSERGCKLAQYDPVFCFYRACPNPGDQAEHQHWPDLAQLCLSAGHHSRRSDPRRRGRPLSSAPVF